MNDRGPNEGTAAEQHAEQILPCGCAVDPSGELTRCPELLMHERLAVNAAREGRSHERDLVKYVTHLTGVLRRLRPGGGVR